jgi:hypothetical protein
LRRLRLLVVRTLPLLLEQALQLPQPLLLLLLNLL